MNEIVINGFNSMILTNTKGWKEVVQFILKNLNKCDQQKLIEKLLEKVISLNKSYVNLYVYEQVLELADLTIDDKKIKS